MNKFIALIIVLATSAINTANASWQAYVDDSLVSTGHVSKGAIIGTDGSTWAATSGFNVSETEATALVSRFSDTDNHSNLAIGGVVYYILSLDAESVSFKKGPSGGTASKTGSAVVLGIYDEPMTPSSCNSTVQGLADYLIQNSY